MIKAKSMTYRHEWMSFTTSYKAKREAQYNGGFHFVPYSNDSIAPWWKHDSCANNATNHSTQTNCAPLDWRGCLYETKRDQYTFWTFQMLSCLPWRADLFEHTTPLCRSNFYVNDKIVNLMYDIDTNSTTINILNFFSKITSVHCYITAHVHQHLNIILPNNPYLGTGTRFFKDPVT